MTMTDPREVLVDDFARILENDPGALDPTDPRYVPNLHGQGVEDVVETLARSIRRASDTGSHVYYFSGQRGTGKSTELRRLMGQLNGQAGTRAFLVDVLDYISESHPITTLDLLLVMALAFADRLSQTDALGEDLLKDSVITRLTNWLQSEVNLSSVTVGGIKAEFSQRQRSILQHLQQVDSARQDRIMEQCQEFIRDLADIVRRRWQVDKVVLLVDSLERLRAVDEGSIKNMFDHVVGVFDTDRDRLRPGRVHIVYAVPPYLPYLSNVGQYVQMTMLASVRVCQPPNLARRVPRSEGLAIMHQVLDRRFPRWAEVISPAALDVLALKSGGDLRQLLRRFVLMAVDHATYALDRLPLQVDDPVIQTVLERQRVEFEGLVSRDEHALLHTIAVRNALDLPARKDWLTVVRFFEIRALLNYRNGTDWLDINPLLWPLIDAHQPRPGDDRAGHDERAAAAG
jgi:hypothetical protein